MKIASILLSVELRNLNIYEYDSKTYKELESIIDNFKKLIDDKLNLYIKDKNIIPIVTLEDVFFED